VLRRAGKRLDQPRVFDLSDAQVLLMRGFLREADGEADKARDDWRQGFQIAAELLLQGRDTPDTRIHSPASLLVFAVLGSLSEQYADEHIDWLISRAFGRAQAGEVLRAVAGYVNGSDQDRDAFRDVLRGMWRTPRGKQLARRIAFQDLAIADATRAPLVLAASQYAQRAVLAGMPSSEQDELIWNVFDELSRLTFATGEMGVAQLVQLSVAWRFPDANGYLGWSQLKGWLGERTHIRGPLAYVLGMRCLALKRQEQAGAFFETALADAAPDSVLFRLAKPELERLVGLGD
jgi:hypothetical protein